MSRKALLLLKLVTSLACLSVLLFRQDMAVLVTSLGHTDVALFMTGLVLSSLTIFIRAYKWQLLLQIQGAHVSLNTIHSLSYMALFFNNFFLGSLGGDTFKVYRTQSYSTTKSGAVAAVFVERLSGILMLFSVVSLSYVLYLCLNVDMFADAVPYPILMAGLFLLMLCGIGTKIFLRYPHLGNSMPLLKRMSTMLTYNIAIHKAHISSLLVCMLLSFIYYLICIISMYFFVLAAHAYVSLLNLSFIVPLSMLIIMLPISINGLGIQESAFVFYFEKLGVESSLALTIALLPRIGIYIFSVVGGIIYLIDCLYKR